nr:hypothetical protein [Tanacetum cinerariifolium]
MSRDVIMVGSTMRISLLYRGEYSQWSERFMNYLEEQMDEEAMINSIRNSEHPLPVVAQDALERQMRGSKYGEQDRKTAILYEYETFRATEGEQLLDTYLRYLQVINDLKKCGYKNYNCDMNDSMGYKKKVVVVTSNPLALVAEKTKVSKRKEKVIVQSESEGSDDEDISDLKKITVLLAKAFNRKKYYAKPTNKNLRTSSASSSSTNKKPEYEGHFAKDCKKANVKDYNHYKTKMLLAKKDSDEQVLLAEDQAWMESRKLSSAEETIVEVSYYTFDSESESEYETLEYYDNSTHYGLFMDNDDDQEIFHNAIESASETFNENHIVSQTDHDESAVDHNDSEEKDHLVNKLIKKFNHQIAKKVKAKGDIGVFVGYSKESAAFRIYNKRTRKIHESVNVNFDEISEMASKQFSLEPGSSNLNETGKSSNRLVSKFDEASKKDLEDLFQDLYDEYFDSSKIMKSSTTNVETLINEEVFHEGCSKHMTGNRALLTNFVEKFFGTVYFGNNYFAVIAGYGDVVIGLMMIKKVYYVQDGVDLFTGDRSSNLYTIALNEIASNSSACLLAKASYSQSWLWHQRLSHLNFATINNLVKNNLVRGLPMMKFKKDHLCPACEQGKIHRKHHKSKMDFALNKPLYFPYMDLCGPIHVESINRKRYVLVVVDDYSRYTSVFFPHSKDEAYEVIISFTKKTTPQQNGVVEKRNQTLVEAARTMLIFANLPLFLWAEAIAIACFTQNCSIIHKRFDKTPYELINKRKPNIKFFHVFECKCYLLNNYDDVGKLKEKGDIRVFVGYLKESTAFRVYNKRTRKIHESVNVNFDGILEIISKQFSLEPSLSNLYKTGKSSNLMISQVLEILKNDLEDLVYNFTIKESSSSLLNADVQQSSKEVMVPSSITQSISNKMVLNVNEASSSHNVFNERLEDTYFDAMDTPMVEKSKLDEDREGKAVDPSHYRGMIGTLLYLTASRPDL